MAAFQAEVLKQPRGLLRCFQWFFAMLAFATCAGYSSHLVFQIECKNPVSKPYQVETTFSYPFQLDHIPMQNHTIQNCDKDNNTSLNFSVSFPGDFSSDAKFFVFVGVVCWLYTMISLAVYTLLSDMYEDQQRNLPLYDLVCTVVFAFFWLAASSAWANGLRGLKSVAELSSWIYSSPNLLKVCEKTAAGTFEDTLIKDCQPVFTGIFGEGNVSVIVGFLNVFLWSANVWFLYKETKWYRPNPGNLQSTESPTSPSG